MFKHLRPMALIALLLAAVLHSAPGHAQDPLPAPRDGSAGALETQKKDPVDTLVPATSARDILEKEKQADSPAAISTDRVHP